jgi:peptidoglycan/xylan/chitin deacetylase (PgdA/CDA1 family)
MSANDSAIPVVMYHTVGQPLDDWRWSFLTVPYTVFEDHLKWLARSGYRTVTLAELRRHVAGEELLPRKSVALTFDDGYLDNWTHAAPLLRKYGFTGTVFINPEFVDPRDVLRPNLEDVWRGEILEDELEVRGFLSWPEIRSLDADGVLRAESHAMSHTWYPISPTIVDFHHPNDGHYWLDWNTFPDAKPFYLRDPAASNVSLGAPIYEHAKSLAATRFFPNPGETEDLIDFVRSNGGPDFFASEDWREILTARVQTFRKTNGCANQYETEQDRDARYDYELDTSKATLEKHLGRSVDFLCWPGGGYSAISTSKALNLYSAVTLGSSDSSRVRNRPGDDPRFIKRMGVPAIEGKMGIRYPGGRYLIHALREYQGSVVDRAMRRALKLTITIEDRVWRDRCWCMHQEEETA